MAMLKLALFTTLTVSLAAQEGNQGFKWLAIQAGSISFDPEEKVGSAPFFGGQLGMVPGPGRYGYSLQLQMSHPKSDLLPGVSPNHREISATFLNGLAGDASSRYWPYFGIGLGALTYPRYSAATNTHDTHTAGAAHTSLGVLHRPGRLFIWGAEWRHLIAFTKRDMSESQFSLMAGISWGSRPSAPRVEASAPPPPPPVQPAPEPTPVVVAPPAPVKAPAVVVPPAPAPAAAVVPPAPTPVLTPVVIAQPAPPPPAPPPVVAPVPKAPAPAPAPAGPADDSKLSARLEALRQGNIPKVLELGRDRMKSIPAGHWTIRLEIANLPSTLKSAVEAFGSGKPDLFVAPIKLRGGKTAYQLFLGSYASKPEAERAVQSAPMFFREGGQKPLPMLGSEIPTQVNR